MIAPIKRMTLPENNFPTVWQTVIFRNYGFVETERIAKTLQTDVATIDAEAKRLGISKFNTITDFDDNGYITIIRNNWFLLPYDQLCTLTGFSMDKLEFVLKEEDFLWVKLAHFKPQCKPVKYKPLSQTAIRKTERIAKIVSKYYENGYGKCVGRMARCKAISATTIAVYDVYHIHQVRILRRAESGKERLADTGRNLVGQCHDNSQHAQNQEGFLELVVSENYIQQCDGNRCPYIGTCRHPHKTIPKQ